MDSQTYKEEKEYQIDEVKNHWFKDHKATLSECGDLVVLDWKQPETIIFSVRYVFDRNYMYVSGDLGEAVFHFTEKAIPERIARYNTDYFCEKLSAFSGPKRDFDRLRANEYLNEMTRDWEEAGDKYDKEACDELRGIIEDCSSDEHYHIALAGFDYSRLGNDSFEWISEIGSVIPMRLRAYLLGIQMAVDKLIAGTI